MDRKYVYTLHECSDCHLVFRYPAETTESAARFYQRGYSEPGLTTDLPTLTELQELKAASFQDSGKNFDHHIEILKALGLKEGDKVLDFGANWGYLTYQLRCAGFNAQGYELSVPRAQYGAHLGIDILTDWQHVPANFDLSYSNHVLEHVPDPFNAIQDQLAVVRPGGLVVAHTPNGGSEYRRVDPKTFRRSWGEVHPVLVTPEFVQTRFRQYAFYVSSDDDPDSIRAWDQRSQHIGDTSGGGLFLAIVSAA